MLIYIDNEGIEQEKEFIKLATSNLNYLLELLHEQEIKLTQAEIKELPDNAENVIMKKLRKSYPYKKAKDAINLELLGIDLSKVIGHIKNNAEDWMVYAFNYSAGSFSIDNHEKYLKKHYHYTKSDHDKKLVLTLEAFARKLNELSSMGSVSIRPLITKLPNVFRVIQRNPFTDDYVVLDGKKTSNYLIGINHKVAGLTNRNQLIPKEETPEEAFKKRGMKHLTDQYKSLKTHTNHLQPNNNPNHE